MRRSHKHTLKCRRLRSWRAWSTPMIRPVAQLPSTNWWEGRPRPINCLIIIQLSLQNTTGYHLSNGSHLYKSPPPNWSFIFSKVPQKVTTSPTDPLNGFQLIKYPNQPPLIELIPCLVFNPPSVYQTVLNLSDGPPTNLQLLLLASFRRRPTMVNGLLLLVFPTWV